MTFIQTSSEAVNRMLADRLKASENEQEASLRAFEQMARGQAAAFDINGALPEIKKEANTIAREIPLFGYYGDSFFSAKPSAELLAKEKQRFYHKDDQEDELAVLEKGLCKKFKINVPHRWPNRRGDRGESGEQILILGSTVNDRRNPKLWGIRSEDRSRHSFLIGGSGTGKSTLISSLMIEDLWYWRGGLIMEPHGDLALTVLRTCPPYRIHDTLYLNVLDPIASPGFNPLELPPDADDSQRAEAVGAVVSLMSKHFDMEKGMVRLRKLLENALNALSYVPGSTLLEVMDFYNNEDIRKTVLSFMPDGPQKEAIAQSAEMVKPDELGSLDNRMQRFQQNRYMKHLFGQSQTTVDFFDLMNKGYFIICPVSKGGTQDDTFLKFYGSYIVSEVYKAALRRESIEEMERVNFPLTLDEFQNFVSDDLKGILAEARKYGLAMMMANQYLAQLPASMKAAVLQNTGTKLCYALDSDDAKVMAQSYGFGMKAADMMSTPKYHTMASPLIRGGHVRPFISAVFPPITMNPELSAAVAELIAENTREKYMKSRDDIEAEIADRRERLASGNQQAVRELITKKNS